MVIEDHKHRHEMEIHASAGILKNLMLMITVLRVESVMVWLKIIAGIQQKMMDQNMELKQYGAILQVV